MYHEYITTVDDGDDLDQCQIIDNIEFLSVGENLIGVIMTPVCDIAQDKVDHFNLCALLPFEDYFFKTILKNFKVDKYAFKNSLSKSKAKEINKFLVSFLNNQLPRFHYIGDLINEDGLWYIDYQLIQSVHVNRASNLLKNRLAKISSPLKESIFVRFAHYLGRVGLNGENEDRIREAERITAYLQTS
jgi:hypothetical protein